MSPNANEKSSQPPAIVEIVDEDVALSNGRSLSSQLQATTSHRISEKPSHDTLDVAAHNSLSRISTESAGVPDASRNAARLNPFDSDIEAMITQTTTGGDVNSQAPKAIRSADSDARVWPGQKHWKMKAKEAKAKRSCSCLSRLGKRNRMIAKILIGVFIIGIAVAVGFGVSKPLGAGIWKAGHS